MTMCKRFYFLFWIMLTAYRIHADVVVQLRGKPGVRMEGMQVWLLSPRAKGADYTSKEFYHEFKPYTADANGRVVADVEWQKDQPLRVVITDPRVETVDLSIPPEKRNGPVTVALTARPSNGRIQVDLSTIPENDHWKGRWKASTPDQWMIALRLRNQQGELFLEMVRYEKGEVELFGLPDGVYTLELVAMSKFKAGGDGFLVPVDQDAGIIRIQDGSLAPESRVLRLRMMQP
jgi:hypothetical protein